MATARLVVGDHDAAEQAVAQRRPGGVRGRGAVEARHARAGSVDHDGPARGERGGRAGRGRRLDADRERRRRLVTGEADRRRREGADADLAEHDVEGLAGLLRRLREDRRVPVRDPLRDRIRRVVGDIGEHRGALARRLPRQPPRRRPRSDPRRARPRRPPRRWPPRATRWLAAGRKIRAARPRCAAARATARPWLPSLAAHTLRSPGLPASRRSSAHDAPLILKAGRPKRPFSSFSQTAPSPSAAASSARARSGVGA